MAASKEVLMEAIKKLEIQNDTLRKEFRQVCCDSPRGKDILAKIARNDSMILDYQFQIKYD